MSTSIEHASTPAEESEDELDWEEVEVPEGQQPQKHLEITIQTTRQKADTVNKKQGISHAERLLRVDCHKVHTVALLANGWIRNRWINDPLLHARLLSLTPLSLQNAFGMIHKSREPDQNMRGRMFENAMLRLTEWWSESFFEVVPTGHLRNRTFDEVREQLAARGLLYEDAVLDAEAMKDILDEESETIRGPKSLMKHALMQSGSRDTSAQLFTALCRALNIPARLVVSLQSVPWQAGVGKPKTAAKSKGKGKAKEQIEADESSEEDDFEEVQIPGSPALSTSDLVSKEKDIPKAFQDGSTSKSAKAKGKEKAKPPVTLRGARIRSSARTPEPSSRASGRLLSPDPLSTPPVFWTEVFSRPDARWLPVDPIRGIVNKRKVFDPTPIASTVQTMQPGSRIYPHPYAPSISPAKKGLSRTSRQENRMVYVVAFEEDGYARDVTRRYAREFNTKVSKVQGGSSAAGKVRRHWWENVMSKVTRPFRLHRDDLEDEELEAAQMTEGMPTTLAGFKDHPLYILVRHLKQTQIIYPPPPETKEIGKFRGEPVYPRSAALSLKTAENWMRSEGRSIIEGSQPLKFVKVRTGTINRMRELEVLRDTVRDAGEPTESSSASAEIMQGLYARSQTELYRPDPVVDGKVPKNNFGNIDLYVPSMLPQGGVHIPFKGVAKIAKKLGFDYAEAVTGFEFKKRRAFPVVEGIVVAKENEAAILDAYWEAEREAQEKARQKREDRVIKHWTRIVQGLRIKQRLKNQYAKKPDKTATGEEKTEPGDRVSDKSDGGASKEIYGDSGGFLAGADDVVQAFSLPKYQHFSLSSTSTPRSSTRAQTPTDELSEQGFPSSSRPEGVARYDMETFDLDSDDMEEVYVSHDVPSTVAEHATAEAAAPKTMQELAEDAAASMEREKTRAADAVEIIEVSRPKTGSSGTGTASVAGDKGIDARSRKAGKRKAAPHRPRRGTRKRDRNEASSDEEAVTSDDSSAAASSPRKRPRRQALKDTSAPMPTPSRTLRPRRPKTTVQILEQEEREQAIREALGE